MKFIKKLFTKICGIFKYLKYLGKLTQVLKILAGLIPQIIPLVPEENQKLLQDISSSLDKIADGMKITDQYLQDMGVTTDLPEVKTRGRKSDKITLTKSSAMLNKIAEEM